MAQPMGTCMHTAELGVGLASRWAFGRTRVHGMPFAPSGTGTAQQLQCPCTKTPASTTV